MKKKLLELIPYVVIIIVVVLIRTFIITPVRVTGTSMNPTLTNGEIMLLYKLVDIEKYDIVVIDDSIAGDDLIKRVIGMPGDSVEFIGGRLFINDEEVPDIYGSGETGDFNKVFLGKDEYWVMGDNREVSLDSRVFGKIKRSDIKGKTIFILFPFKSFGSVEK